MNLAHRTRANLVAVALASGVLIIYALSRLLMGAIGEAGYPLTVLLPSTGGITTDQQVSVDGRIIGTVTDVDLTDEGVAVHVAIDEGEGIPVDASARVLRRSVIGEQALDFVSDGPPSGHHEPGTTFAPADVLVPVNVQELLELADSRLAAVDPDDLAGALSGLADAVDGRRDDIGRLVRGGAELTGALADSDAEVVRLLSSLRAVTATVAEHRETAVRTIDELADALAVLGTVRGDLEGLIADAPDVLVAGTDLLDRGGPDLGCLVRDMGATAAALDAPEVRDDLERALRRNQWFFTGIEIGAPVEVDGAVWLRVRLLLPPPPAGPPDSYLPSKRPVPPVRPGGACRSALGAGAPAAGQPGWTRVIPDAGFEPPADAAP